MQDIHWPMSFILSNKFKAFIDNIPMSVVVSDREGHIVTCNNQILNLLGYSYSEMISLMIEDLVPFNREHHKQLRKQFFKKPSSRYIGQRDVELSVLSKQGHIIPMDAALFSVETDKGVLAINLIKDTSEQIEYEKELLHKALYDQLTGLPNRHYLEEVFMNLANFASRIKEKIAIYLVDIDKFKLINDNFGHDMGDKVLIAISKKINSFKRKNDFIVRLGGDEFLICAMVKDKAAALNFGSRLSSLLNCSTIIKENTFNTSASIGIAVSAPENIELNQLIKDADDKMYEIKRKGGGSFAF